MLVTKGFPTACSGRGGEELRAEPSLAVAERRFSLRRCLALVLVGAWNAEAVSMGTFPYEFLYPSNIVVTFMYYALQLLILEDIYSRFDLNYKDVFFLGVLFGLLEEGVMTLTFYAPVTEWLKPGYGRFLGLNTVWATFLTVFHAVYTVTLTFLIVDRYFPRNRGPILTRRKYLLVLTYLAALYVGNPIYVSVTQHFKPRLEAALAVASLIAVFAILSVKRVKDRSHSRTLLGGEYEGGGRKVKRYVPVVDVSILTLLQIAWWLPYSYQYEGFPEVGALVYLLLFVTLAPLGFVMYLKRSGGAWEERLKVITATIIGFYGSLGALGYFLANDYVSSTIILFTLLVELELVFKKPIVLRALSKLERKIVDFLT